MNNINQEIEDLEATLVSLKAKAKAQEHTLTPVSFESERELAKALVDGRTFKTRGTTLMYATIDRGSSPFRLMRDGKDRGPMTNTWAQYDNLQEINAAEPWYLNIPPEGIRCYVSDVDPKPCRIKKLVRRYKQGSSMPFRCAHDGWEYATPVNEGKIT
tara:strand:- start:14 stop:487 length:474 start_codon:yes stop_codon:yes gene_type:complete